MATATSAPPANIGKYRIERELGRGASGIVYLGLDGFRGRKVAIKQTHAHLLKVPGAQPWLLGIGNLRGNLFPVVDLKQFLEGERTVLHEGQRVLVMRQAGGDVALTIDELYGQRSFHESQRVEPGDLADGRYGHFIDRAFASDDQRWGVFALGLLARTPEFRQTAL